MRRPCSAEWWAAKQPTLRQAINFNDESYQGGLKPPTKLVLMWRWVSVMRMKIGVMRGSGAGGLIAAVAGGVAVLTAIGGAVAAVVNLSAGYVRLGDKVTAVATAEERLEGQITGAIHEIRADQIRNSEAQTEALHVEVARRDASDAEIKTLLMRVYDRVDAIADQWRVRRNLGNVPDGPALVDGSQKGG